MYRPNDIMFQATADKFEAELFKFRPSIFMPRWASRITLEVTNVVVERLQDITPAQAISEGIEYIGERPIGTPQYRDYLGIMSGYSSPVLSFRTLWDSLNDKRGLGWGANPWVAAYAFKVYQQNVDEYLKELG